MSEPLPVQLDPVLLADRGRSLSGHLPVQVFRRLAAWLHSTEGQLTFELAFDRDPQGRRRMRGVVRGGLELLCQRCLAAYTMALCREFDLVLVSTEAEAGTLPDEIDAVLTGETRDVHTVDLLEDELILALPLVPRCEIASACRPAVELLDSDKVLATEPGERQQPFADLTDHVDKGPREQ